MAVLMVMHGGGEHSTPSSVDLSPTDSGTSSHGVSFEKIDVLESMFGKVVSRRSRRLLNDRLLMALVPRLNADEIRGLFTPPPWGDYVAPSPFCMANGKDWEIFINVDMDEEVRMKSGLSSKKVRGNINGEKAAVMSAWRRMDTRTRSILRRRGVLLDLIDKYEGLIRGFLEVEGGRMDSIVLKVKSSFQRLVLHGVCEFYNLDSVTEEEVYGKDGEKVTKVSRRNTTKGGVGSTKLPEVGLAQFLRMSKTGEW